MAIAASGSAHFTRHIALIASPAKAMSDRYAHSADCAVSALNAALSVVDDSRRFSFASSGMTAADAASMAIPRNVGLGSPYPSNVMTEVTTTQAARANSISRDPGRSPLGVLLRITGAEPPEHNDLPIGVR